MGKRGGKLKNANGGVSGGYTVRGGNSGKKPSQADFLKLQHLQKLAAWASGEAGVPSLGAFFGNRFAACGEAMGVPPDQSLLTCERCETILHPGNNCTVRIEKNRARRPKQKGSKMPTQNNVVYRCHFCSHQTVKRGTLKGHMKQICPPKAKPAPISHATLSTSETAERESDLRDRDIASTTVDNTTVGPCVKNKENASVAVEVASLEHPDSKHVTDSRAPVTPLVKTGMTLLETIANKRKRKKSGVKKEPESNPAKVDEPSPVSTSKKRRRKTWTSLNDLMKSNRKNAGRNLSDTTIPFVL